VSTRSMVMPWAVKKAVARRRNPAVVTARSSVRDWREREPGVGVDRGVPVPVADLLPAGGAVLGAAAAVDPRPAAGGDCPDLLHVQVDVLTWAFSLDSPDLAVAVAGDVEIAEPADPELAQPAVHRRGGHLHALGGELIDNQPRRQLPFAA